MDLTLPAMPGVKATTNMAGVWDLSVHKGEGDGMRFARVRKYVQELEPQFVVYELVNFPHKSVAAEKVYWGIIGVVTEYAASAGIQYQGIATNDLKKRATGKGGGKGTDKPAISHAANVFFNINPPLSLVDKPANKDHNIADALWLMQIAIEEHAPFLKV
jgi:Holliday junction resolvasome RuvABC endonuclease subunit